MKRIAVACEDTMVADHFGHCTNFMFFNTVLKNLFIDCAVSSLL